MSVSMQSSAYLSDADTWANLSGKCIVSKTLEGKDVDHISLGNSLSKSLLTLMLLVATLFGQYKMMPKT